LERLSLSPSDFIILADSTPVPIESAHVSMNVPCQIAAEGNNITTSTTTNSTQEPSSDIKIMAGVAPDLEPAIPEYIAGLSRPEIGKCTYHVDTTGCRPASDRYINNEQREPNSEFHQRQFCNYFDIYRRPLT
jgi:hypothetical protein